MIRGKFLVLKNVMKIQHVHVSVVIESPQSDNLYLTSLYFHCEGYKMVAVLYI